jgi:2-phospho-L-lactate transferase/gluconeogenesis factor (CofD/UPF0052 family)
MPVHLPDLDTVTYTLAGMANTVTGWGIQNDTFKTFEKLQENGSPTWFKLGDQDIATHMERTRLLQEGKTLTEVVHHFCEIWNVKPTVLPMCDLPVPTMVDTVVWACLHSRSISSNTTSNQSSRRSSSKISRSQTEHTGHQSAE